MLIGDRNKKRAGVVIGINYPGTSCQLSGCVNDANNMAEFLTSHCGYDVSNLCVLTDDGKPATLVNILGAFDWLLSKAASGYTELWLSYSGHGSYVQDINGDEKDGRDEAICPIDCDTAGFIIDDDIFSRFVSKIPAGVSLFAVFDCCHSGTVLDLPLLYTGDKVIVNNDHHTCADVISISGCRDEQTSADAYISGKYAGALTWSFLTAIREAKYSISLCDLVANIRSLLKGKYEQVPMLALSSEEIRSNWFIGMTTHVNTVSTPNKPNQLAGSAKPITFILTADMHPGESAWNVWVDSTGKWLFPVDSVFTQRYQRTELTVNLRPGKYKLVVKDSYGDGGVTVSVLDSNYNLVNETVAKGKLAEYSFKVKV